MRQESFQSLLNGGFHRVAYTDWGSPANPHVVVCVHGLARNSRDFDFLAAALTPDCRVVCMDVAGRGGSRVRPPGAERCGTAHPVERAFA